MPRTRYRRSLYLYTVTAWHCCDSNTTDQRAENNSNKNTNIICNLVACESIWNRLNTHKHTYTRIWGKRNFYKKSLLMCLAYRHRYYIHKFWCACRLKLIFLGLQCAVALSSQVGLLVAFFFLPFLLLICSLASSGSVASALLCDSDARKWIVCIERYTYAWL